MEFLFNTAIPEIIVTVFLHSLWQGFIIALAAWLLLRVTKFSPAVRYNLLAGFLFLFIACVVITFLTQLPAGTSIAAEHRISSPVVAPSESFFQSIFSWCHANAPWIMMGWFLFFMFRVTQLVRGLIAVEKLSKTGLHRSTTKWMQTINELKEMLGLKKKIGLHESNFVQQPLVIGFLKPVILVPIGFFNNLQPQEVEAILLHELAHIRRNDYLVNLFQQLLESIFFFNPFVHWLSEMIRDEREVCCDALAIEKATNKKIFLEAILSFHEKLPASPYAMAFLGNKTQLMKRIDRIMHAKETKNSVTEKLALLFSYSILFIFLVSFSLIQKKSHEIPESAFPLFKKVSTITSNSNDTIPNKNLSKEFLDGYKAGQQFKSGRSVMTNEKKKQAEQKFTNEFIAPVQQNKPVKQNDKPRVADEFITVIQERASRSANDKKKIERELIESTTETVIQQPNRAATTTIPTGGLHAKDKKRIEQELIAAKKN